MEEQAYIDWHCKQFYEYNQRDLSFKCYVKSYEQSYA